MRFSLFRGVKRTIGFSLGFGRKGFDFAVDLEPCAGEGWGNPLESFPGVLEKRARFSLGIAFFVGVSGYECSEDGRGCDNDGVTGPFEVREGE
jgi:hypothetical protein